MLLLKYLSLKIFCIIFLKTSFLFNNDIAKKNTNVDKKELYRYNPVFDSFKS